MGEKGDLKETLKKLHGLTLDDKTQNLLLRSRIEEQSQLICALKRRADEALLRCQGLDVLNTELEAAQEDVARQLRQEVDRAELLERRFNDLANNHQQMIKFKDEYKAQNEDLRQECDLLRQENETLFSQGLRERDDEIHRLREEVERLTGQLATSGQDLEDKMAAFQVQEVELLEKQKQREASHSLELQALKLEMQQATKERQLAEVKLRSLEETRSAVDPQLEKLCAEKQELLQLSMQRGKVIQDKQRELGQLEEKLRVAEHGQRDAEERYKKGMEEVDANLKVKALRQQLEAAGEQEDSLRKEFEAFKKHSADMLTKERELNAKLRHLIG